MRGTFKKTQYHQVTSFIAVISSKIAEDSTGVNLFLHVIKDNWNCLKRHFKGFEHR